MKTVKTIAFFNILFVLFFPFLGLHKTIAQGSMDIGKESMEMTSLKKDTTKPDSSMDLWLVCNKRYVGLYVAACSRLGYV